MDHLRQYRLAQFTHVITPRQNRQGKARPVREHLWIIDNESLNTHYKLIPRQDTAGLTTLASGVAQELVGQWTAREFSDGKKFSNFRDSTEAAHRLDVEAKEHRLNRQIVDLFAPFCQRI